MALRNIALATLFLTSSGIAYSLPAHAQEQEKQQASKKQEKQQQPKLSKPIIAVVVAAQKLQQAGDLAGAYAKLSEASQVPRVEKDDASFLAKLKISFAQLLKDNEKIEEAVTEALEVPTIEPEEKMNFAKYVSGIAAQRKDYQKAWKWSEFYLAQKPDDVDMLIRAASVNAALGAKPRVVELLGKAIELREAAGEKGDRSWYEFRAQSVIDSNMIDKIMPALLSWVKAFPEPSNYNKSIELVKQRGGSMDNNMLLDWGRLMWAAGAMTTGNNYLEYADAAIERGMPNEADMVLKEAITKKLIDPSKQNVGEIVRLAASKNTETKAALPGLEKEAGTNPRIGLVVADTLANLGQHEKAVGFYQKLVGNAAVDQDTVNLRMGAAMLKMGNKDGAKAAFAAVKTGPRAQIAQFYGVLAGA